MWVVQDAQTIDATPANHRPISTFFITFSFNSSMRRFSRGGKMLPAYIPPYRGDHPKDSPYPTGYEGGSPARKGICMFITEPPALQIRRGPRIVRELPPSP